MSTSRTPLPLSRRRPLRVLTMNLWGFAEPYRARLRLLREGIRRLDPDLMAFQEAGFDGKRHQVAALLDGLGYHVHHQFDRQPRRGDNANCLATRWPISKIGFCSFRRTTRRSRYPLGALAARVEAPEPVGPFWFVCAKPSWELDAEQERELQAVALAKFVARRARRGDFPTVIAGDFDAAPDSASIRFLTGRQSLRGRSIHYLDAWQQAGDGSAGYTWTYQNPGARGIIEALRLEPRHARRIDYIFVASFHAHDRFARVRRCRVVLHRPKGGVWPSDHYAVYAEISVTR